MHKPSLPKVVLQPMRLIPVLPHVIVIKPPGSGGGRAAEQRAGGRSRPREAGLPSSVGLPFKKLAAFAKGDATRVSSLGHGPDRREKAQHTLDQVRMPLETTTFYLPEREECRLGE